jgi:hypothetical protein
MRNSRALPRSNRQTPGFPGRIEVPHTLLAGKNPASQRGNAQLVVFHASMHRIAGTDPERLAHCGRDHQSPFVADLRPSLKFYLTSHRIIFVIQIGLNLDSIEPLPF